MESWSNDDWSAYVKAVEESAKRCRQTLILIVAVSIVMMSCVWFNRPHNWTEERIKCLSGKVLPLQPYSKETSDRIDFLMKLSIERGYVISVPVLGLAIDPNDLQTVGGFTLFVLLTVLYNAGARELANLRHAVWLVGHSPRRTVHAKQLAMSQVLTVTPDVRTSARAIGGAVTLLPLLPALVIGSAVVFDLATVENGWAVSPLNTIITSSLGFTFLLLCVVLGTRCRRVGKGMAQQWNSIEELLLHGLGTSNPASNALEGSEAADAENEA